MDLRRAVIEGAWSRPLLWRGLKAVHPWYTVARCHLRRRPRLRWVGFEVTNRCNLACVMCGGQLMTRPRGVMAAEVFDEVIAQIPDGSLFCIALHAVGEPLLHPQIERFVRGARPKAREVFLSTNGLLFRGDERLMRGLLDAGLTHVHFSAEGYDAATYESTRVGGRFAEFLDAVRRFRRVRDAAASRASIHLQYTLFRTPDRDELRNAVEVLGPHVDSIEFRPLNNQSSAKIGYRPGESLAGVRCFADTPIPCLALWCGVTVLWDGRISLCPRDQTGHAVIAGKGTPLAAAWSSARARELRRMHAWRRFPDPCRDCFEPHARTLAVLELDRRLNAIGAAAAAEGHRTGEPAGTAVWSRFVGGRDECNDGIGSG
jgi:MoaA/NifB/PqqE/SkfB family radical SAM enzyme